MNAQSFRKFALRDTELGAPLFQPRDQVPIPIVSQAWGVVPPCLAVSEVDVRTETVRRGINLIEGR